MQIIGGGLAGLSLGIGLRMMGVPVVVREAGRYPRHRVCGEFISGVSDHVLDRLGIGEDLADALRPSSLVWMNGGRVIYEGGLPVAARAISRHAVDARLAERLMRLGGEIRTGERHEGPEGEGWVRCNGRDQRANGTRIGLKAHVRGLGLRKELEMHLGSNGYVGLVEVEGGWVNVCGIFQSDRAIRGRGIELLADYVDAGGNSALADVLRGAEVRDGSFCAIAGFEPGRQAVREGELCIGDAERMIPPFTGNGMSMAFEAAEAALDPLIAWSRGELEWRHACHAIRHELGVRFRKRMVAARWVEPMLGRRVVHDLIGLTLGQRLPPFSVAYSLFR